MVLDDLADRARGALRVRVLPHRLIELPPPRSLEVSEDAVGVGEDRLDRLRARLSLEHLRRAEEPFFGGEVEIERGGEKEHHAFEPVGIVLQKGADRALTEGGPDRLRRSVLGGDGVEVVGEVGEPVAGLRRARVAVAAEAEAHGGAGQHRRERGELLAGVAEAVREHRHGVSAAVDLHVEIGVGGVEHRHVGDSSRCRRPSLPASARTQRDVVTSPCRTAPRFRSPARSRRPRPRARPPWPPPRRPPRAGGGTASCGRSLP